MDTTGSTQTGDVYYGATITLKASVAEGYTWSKWSNGSTGKESSATMPASALTITPERTLVSYSITYTMNNGTNASGNPSSYTVESDTITLADPSRTDYTFNGWTGSNGSTAQKDVQIPKGSTGNRSYTANWTANGASVDIQWGGDISIVTVNGTEISQGTRMLKPGDRIYISLKTYHSTSLHGYTYEWNVGSSTYYGSGISCTVPAGASGSGELEMWANVEQDDDIRFGSAFWTNISGQVARSGACASWTFSG